jgi:hypothetical protein
VTETNVFQLSQPGTRLAANDDDRAGVTASTISGKRDPASQCSLYRTWFRVRNVTAIQFQNRAVVEGAGVHYRPIVTVTPVTRESQPRPGLAAGGFSLSAVVGVWLRGRARGRIAGRRICALSQARGAGESPFGSLVQPLQPRAKTLESRPSVRLLVQRPNPIGIHDDHRKPLAR